MKKIKSDGKAVSVWFSADILRRLDILAEEFQESRSALINKFLDERMSMYEELLTVPARVRINEFQEDEYE